MRKPIIIRKWKIKTALEVITALKDLLSSVRTSFRFVLKHETHGSLPFAFRRHWIWLLAPGAVWQLLGPFTRELHSLQSVVFPHKI